MSASILVTYELKKIFSFRSVPLFLALIVVLNTVLNLYFGVFRLTEEYTLFECSKAEAYYATENSESTYQDAVQWMNLFAACVQGNNGTNSKTDTSSPIAPVTGNIRKEFFLVQRIMDRSAELIDYPDYLRNVQISAEELLQEGFGGHYNHFATQSIKKTAVKYAKLPHVIPEYVNSSVYSYAFGSRISALFAALFVFLISIELVFCDRRNATLYIVKPTPNGGESCFSAKILALAAAAVIATVLIWGINILVGIAMFGVPDLAVSLQSIEGFMLSSWSISAGAFLGLYLLSEFLGLFIFGLVVITVAMLSRSVLSAVLANFFLMVTEEILYICIPYTSPLSLLKQINIIAFIETKLYFTEFRCLNVFGWAFSIYQCFLFSAILFVFIVLFQGRKMWVKISPREDTVINSSGRKYRRTFGPSGVCGYEIFKAFIMNGGVLFLVLLLGIQFFLCRSSSISYSDADYWYEHYADSVKGKYTQDNYEMLVNRKYEIDNSEKQIAEIMERVDKGDLNSDYAMYLCRKINVSEDEKEGFKKVLNQYEYLRLRAYSGENVEFVSVLPYERVFDNAFAIKASAVLWLFCGLFSAVLFTQERTCNMECLLFATPYGFKKTIKRKKDAAFIWCVFAGVICFVPWIWHSMTVMPLACLSAPACSFPGFDFVPQQISLSFMFSAILCARILSPAVLSYLVFLLSGKINNRLVLFMSSLLFGTLPCILDLIGYSNQWMLLQLIKTKPLI